jgi:hypothetical protein
MKTPLLPTTLKYGPKIVFSAVAAFERQVRALLSAGAGTAAPQAVSPQEIQGEALAPPQTGVGKLGLAWKQSLLLGILVCCVYSANGYEIPCGDTIPAKLLPIALIRGDGPFLDHIHDKYLPGSAPDEPVPYYVARERGHLVSSYPLGTALLAVPFYLPQVFVLDWLRPGWEKTDAAVENVPDRYSSRMAKNTAAALGALTAVAIFHLLRRLGLGRLALPTALGTAVASNLWADSQTLWQHVPAALALTLSVTLLVPAPVSRRRLLLAGLTTAALVWIRSQDVLLAAVILLWVARYQPRDLGWFLPLPLLLGGALVGYNYWFFGMVTGGYGRLDADSALSLRLATLIEGVAGNLWSPRRSLFVFCPWTALALATAPIVVARLRPRSIVCWLLGALVPYLLFYSSNTLWWHGWYFGPRYFTDVIPLFAILLGFGLRWSWTRCPLVFGAFMVTMVLATGVQLLGAFYYPSSWNVSPINIDQTFDSQRAWDWHDNELSRLLAERPRNLQGWRGWLMRLADYLPAPDLFPMYQPGTPIDFTQVSSVAHLRDDWQGPEAWGRWSGRVASVKFRLERVQPLRLRMMARTLQRTVVRFNGREVQTLPGNAQTLELIAIDLPADATAEYNTLQLTVLDAQSPRSLGSGEDTRILGVGIASMEFAPLPQKEEAPAEPSP